MNFRNLEKLQVPDELMEKLLAIPETAEDKTAAIPWWRNRAVVTAASLVLVSALSLLLYLSFGVKPLVEVRSSGYATEIVWSTDENGETVATEVVIIPEGETRSDGTRLEGTQPTEPKSAIEKIIDRIFGTGDTSPTTASDNRRGDRTAPTTKTSQTDGMTNPSQSAITPTQGVEPEKPTVQPTEPEPIVPTDPPDEPEPIEPTDPPDDPPNPTEPPPDMPWEPTEPPDEYEYTDTITDVVYVGEIEEDAVVYCWLYNTKTSFRLGSDDEIIAEITPLGNGYVRLSYTPKEHGIVLPYKGRYSYRWVMPVSGSYFPKTIGGGSVYLND